MGIKREYLVVYIEQGFNVGNIQINVEGKIDLQEIREIISKKFGFNPKEIIILNLIEGKFV